MGELNQKHKQYAILSYIRDQEPIYLHGLTHSNEDK